tara:strand:+ start:944 stop:1258 length:315 start_codon:yes stop_codon:yes gene_type:complete
MTVTEARTILENKSEHTVQEVKDAKKMIRELNKGGDMKKEVPVIAISVGMGKMKKPKKTAMMRGGMANGKQHMYAAGGMVNDGLKALKVSGPKGLEAFNKITGK